LSIELDTPFKSLEKAEPLSSDEIQGVRDRLLEKFWTKNQRRIAPR